MPIPGRFSLYWVFTPTSFREFKRLLGREDEDMTAAD
jgi:hypothetical protein